MGSYDDTIAVGRVLYAGNLPIVPPDECWIPAKTDPVKLSIVPVGGIHIFIGETVDSDGNPLEVTVEDQCRSAWVSQVLEKQRFHFVHFLAHTAGTAPHGVGAGPVQVEVPENNAAPDQQEAVGESETPAEESILGNLSPISGDTQSMDTAEFDRKVTELGYGEQPEVDSVQPKQVLATVAALGEDGSEAADTQSDPQPSHHGSPMSRERPRRDPSSESLLSPEEIVAQARMDLVAKSDVLNKPITPGDAADPEALEATRKEMLATAKKFANTAAAILDEREEAALIMDRFERQDREVTATLEQVKSMRAEWEVKMTYAQAEADRIVREAIPPRRINFATPAEQQPLPTPKDNLARAAEILKKSDEEVDINYLRTLVASAVKQQSKADTSRKLESNPEHCVSTAQKDAHNNRHRDDESRTGSSERRRKAREHPNPIPVPSKTPPSDPRKGKDAMYSGRDKYRNASPPPNGYPRPPRRRSPAGNTRPQGHGGIIIRDIVMPSGNRNRERTPEPRRNQNNDREPEPRRSRNEERDPEPRRSRNDQGSQRHGEGSHRSRSQHREGRGESAGGSRRMIREEPKPRSSLKLPGNLKHYDGTERPDTWIEDYYNAVTFAGGTPNIACRMLQLYLVGPARIWLSDLEKNSIFCWFDLKTAFEKHFRGTYKRPATASDLQACIQKKGETSRNFLTRWLACRNECENVDHTTAMYAFIGGLQRGGLLRHKLTCLANANKLTLDEMISIASDHTAADDDAGGDIAATAIPLHQQKKNRDNGNNSGHKRKNPDDQKSGGSDMVAMAFQRGVQRHALPGPLGSGGEVHSHQPQRKWVNDLKNDPEAGYKRARKHRPRGKGGKGKNKDKEEDSSEAMDEDDNSPDPKAGSAGKSNPFEKKSVGAYTFLGTPTVRATKSATRILNATVPAVPQYVRWSEVPCTFDREDHPAIVPKEYYALVVSPRINGYDFSKCLMDGGASLNIMYLETLERMNLTKEQLKHSTTEFHGVVPGKKANSLGSITLPVAFGDVHNFREEKITFEVVPFKSSYHVIFGRPTYHKFHARACYIYNKLKMPGPNGATYQRTMQRCLKDQIGRNVHAYVDDIAVMTRKGSDLISDSQKPLRISVATNKVISLVIVVERKEEGHEYDVQRPVYYISEVLTESKQRYPHFQKLAYGVFLGSRKLRHYFQEHPVTVVSKAPLSTILNNADATGRTAKWGIELSAFDIAYKPRTAVKSQVLADFVADWTEAPLEPEPETWIMHFDGSKQHQGSGAGVTLKSPTGEELQYVLQIHFEATNNMAEYEALLHGLRIAKEIGIKHIICCGDSDLVAQQVAGTWNARNSVMAAYRDEVDEIAKSFLGYEVKSTGFTPFFLVYGSEAVIPSDIIHDSPRVSAYNEETADEARQLSVDLIEEARNLADQRSAIYQQKLRRYHSRRVRKRSFMAGDLVLRLRQVKDHKLQSPWEGPFVVSKVLHNGSYYLVDFRELRDRPANWHRKRKREDPDDIYDETDRPWNIAQLRPFYT
ncbi:hypothetical protein QYE76_065956 [Lolium multiflorum]|uniref:Uncharacterized protein n=1 Tax=Lolium multiflorum TaxID=4521 RepID=A0AAD8W994_LOLMU|nr:hypothetical protein QYE76_065956 [Lolium multiflorum]